MITINYRTNNKPGEFTYQKNISLLGYEAKCINPEIISLIIDNLCRLGLTETPSIMLIEDNRYNKIRYSDLYKSLINKLNNLSDVDDYREEKKCIGVTCFGRLFIEICYP